MGTRSEKPISFNHSGEVRGKRKRGEGNINPRYSKMAEKVKFARWEKHDTPAEPLEERKWKGVSSVGRSTNGRGEKRTAPPKQAGRTRGYDEKKKKKQNPVVSTMRPARVVTMAQRRLKERQKKSVGRT